MLKHINRKTRDAVLCRKTRSSIVDFSYAVLSVYYKHKYFVPEGQVLFFLRNLLVIKTDVFRGFRLLGVNYRFIAQYFDL